MRIRLILLVFWGAYVFVFPCRCRGQFARSEFRIVFDEARPSYDPARPNTVVDVYITSPWSDRPKRLTSNHRSHSPSWSPDGKQIAYFEDEQHPSVATCAYSSGTLFRMNAAGKDVVSIATNVRANIQETAWLPDGHELALRSTESPTISRCPRDLKLIVAYGMQFESPAESGTRSSYLSEQIQTPRTANKTYFCPQADNKEAVIVKQLQPEAPPNLKPGQIAFSTGDPKREFDFWSSIPFPPDDTSKLRLFSLDRGGMATPVKAYDAQWSPDGRRVAYSRFPDSRNAVLYVADLIEGQLQNEHGLTNQALDAHEPAWSPDGSRIAFAGSFGGGQQIFLMNVDGTGMTQLGQEEGKGHVGYNPILTCTHPSWSPDGKLVVAECQEQQMTSLANLCRNVYGLYTSIYLFNTEKPRSIPHMIVNCSYEASNPTRLYSYQASSACGAHNPSFAPVAIKTTH